MKLITAMVQPQKFADVKRALYEAEVFKMTVTSVQGCGQQRGYEETFRGVISEINLIKKIRIDIAVNEDFVEPTVDAIIKGARSGNIGDGKIFITELAECIRIRTGDRGEDAIG
ncbi:MAG: P-II family nitrogen regulator [Spirochaetales bacterium]|nr:P-II family nitrogen regulator [Spirochaetales bacterium]